LPIFLWQAIPLCATDVEIMGVIKTKSWWERNPKKTIIIVLVPILIVIVFASEKYFEFRNHKNLINGVYHTRYIRLKESPPLMSNYIWPEKKDSDALQFKKYLFRVDNNGFIVPSAKYQNPDKIIVFLGGSTTECAYVEEENRFPYKVGCLLEKKLGKKINSYNGGTAGNNSMHSLFISISKGLPMNPSVVVMMHNINDLIILLYEG